jgi:hypothetical protein
LDLRRTDTVPFTGIPVTWIILWLICYNRRKEDIGGWLLFYYIQLYLSIAITLLVLPFSLDSLLPSRWAGSPGLYALFLLANLPVLTTVIMQVVVAHRLRRSRDPVYLVPLRRILWAELLFSAVKLGIDIKFFQSTLEFDALAVLWAACWLPYFYRSIRVQHVFVTKDWQRIAELVVD